jgi:hypothetical protein
MIAGLVWASWSEVTISRMATLLSRMVTVDTSLSGMATVGTHISRTIPITSNPILGMATGTGGNSDRTISIWRSSKGRPQLSEPPLAIGLGILGHYI